jgi:hypothetical protein
MTNKRESVRRPVKRTQKWQPEWSARRYTVRISPEAHAKFTALASKASAETSRSVTVPDLIEMAADSWVLTQQASASAARKNRAKNT